MVLIFHSCGFKATMSLWGEGGGGSKGPQSWKFGVYGLEFPASCFGTAADEKAPSNYLIRGQPSGQSIPFLWPRSVVPKHCSHSTLLSWWHLLPGSPVMLPSWITWNCTWSKMAMPEATRDIPWCPMSSSWHPHVLWHTIWNYHHKQITLPT